MLKLEDTSNFDKKLNNPDAVVPRLPPAEFSIGDKCILNAVRVDNKADKCWIYRVLVNNAGKAYYTYQVIHHRKKRTHMRIGNSYMMMLCLAGLIMDDVPEVDEYGRQLPIYIYGELLGDDKVHNEHDFTKEFILSRINEYPFYDYRMSFVLSREQYADYIDGVKNRPGAAVIPLDWYENIPTEATGPVTINQ